MKAALCLLSVLASGAAAQQIDLPRGAERVFQEETGAGFDLPVAAWRDGAVPREALQGQALRDVWRVAGAAETSQIAALIRADLRDAEYEILLDCAAQDCGGFDFRFSLDVVAPPAMQVNLGDFRYLSARSGDAGFAALISATPDAVYVQMTRIGGGDVAVTAEAAPIQSFQPSGSIGEALDSIGRVVLGDLTFATGSSQLAEGRFPSLDDLAAYLEERPDLRVALVGHTDSEGSLDGNIALSKRRAGSVLERLAVEYNVPRSQLEAQGMGYLSPIASNLTGEGREANRRVEAIITSTGP